MPGICSSDPSTCSVRALDNRNCAKYYLCAFSTGPEQPGVARVTFRLLVGGDPMLKAALGAGSGPDVPLYRAVGPKDQSNVCPKVSDVRPGEVQDVFNTWLVVLK